MTLCHWTGVQSSADLVMTIQSGKEMFGQVLVLCTAMYHARVQFGLVDGGCMALWRLRIYGLTVGLLLGLPASVGRG